jgi:ribonuclease J
MHDIVKPKILIPMHGEHRHLRQHARLGEEKGIASAIAVNGMMMDLTGDAPKVADYIDTGRTYLDGSVKIGAMDGIVRDRIRMALNGHVVITAILDEEDEPLGEPWVDLKGLAETGQSNAALAEIMEEDLNQFLMRAGKKTLKDDDKLEQELKRIARQTSQSEIGKKPEVTVIVSRMR